MIKGNLSEEGMPVIPVTLANQQWTVIIDTGFNGDLELPEGVRSSVSPQFIGRTRFQLAAGQSSVEDLFLVQFPFDGDAALAEATFTSSSTILMGTGMLRRYRVEVHFPNRSVHLERINNGSTSGAMDGPADSAPPG